MGWISLALSEIVYVELDDAFCSVGSPVSLDSDGHLLLDVGVYSDLGLDVGVSHSDELL